MPHPNIVYVLADDMGYGDVSCLNPDSKILTEHLDKLANAGLVCTDAHSSSAVCTPSRYSIITGRYSWRSRLKSGVVGGYSPSIIEQGRMTVASLLRGQGYHTACIGKWHLGLDWERDMSIPEAPQHGTTEGIRYDRPINGGPLDHGFERFFGIAASLDMPPYVYIDGRHVRTQPDHITQNTGQTMWRSGPTAPDFKHEEVLPTLTKKALELIDEWKDDPFFLYFPLPAPHTPILPVGEFVGKSRTNCYGDFVLMCDDAIGQLRARLEKYGIWNNTIFIFTSDNGCSPAADFPALIGLGHNPSHVFRGHKADIYEGGHRIPYIMSWPEQIHAGTSSDQSVCLSDLMSTLAEIVGVKLPDNAAEDSVSNLNVWRGVSDIPVRDAIVHHSINGSFSIRRGHWKLELCPGSGGWSYPRPGQEPACSPPVQLYNLETDISEQHNVCAEYPELVAELAGLLVSIIKNGRSTPGTPQENTDQDFFSSYDWYKPSNTGLPY